MEKKDILEAIKKAKQDKKNFNQSFDLIFNLKQLNLKKPEHKIDLFVTLEHGKGKISKICGLVDKELINSSKENFDYTVAKDEFKNLDKKKIKKLANEYDYFVAQATIMTDVAKFFGRILGPKGKMPNPKSGCIVPGNIDLKIIKERLQKLLHLQTKNEIIIKTIVGKEDMDDNKVMENILTVYTNLINALPLGRNNIKNIILKLTMGKPVIMGDKDENTGMEEKKGRRH